jgi:RNA polymerase sigma-70 factor (ECF subfamily)
VLARLPVGERDALLLLAWQDLSYAQIATALDIPIGTVRSRLNNARKRRRHALADLGGSR